MILLLALVAAASEPAEFEPSARNFADPAACKAHLVRLAADAHRGGYSAVEGPYDITEGDARIHMIRAESGGHRIEEHRCLGAKLSGRSWDHKMGKAEEAFTIESAARNAQWLKKATGEQE